MPVKCIIDLRSPSFPDGADRVLFGTDMPFDPEKGPGFIRETIAAMGRMRATPEDKAKIYEGNARRMLRLRLS